MQDRHGQGVPAAQNELRARIERNGSVRFDEFVDVTLYHPDGGFFTGGGGAGRGGADFLTSPEVGPLFGAVVARFLDQRWDELGRPDPFVVVEAAAGRGALAIAVLAAAPRCAPALRYVLVERAEELRARQAEHLVLVHPFEVLGPVSDPDTDRVAVDQGSGPLVCALSDLPAEPVDGVVLANELLDNLPFRLLERAEPPGTADASDARWHEVRVALDGATFVELLVPADERVARLADALAPDAAPGARIPVQAAACQWLTEALDVVRNGSVIVIDYASTTAGLAARPAGEWLRTYRRHERGDHPLHAPGSQDLTCEVATDQLDRVASPESLRTQSDWLREHGIDELVDEGRRRWTEHAAAPDLAAMRARSRVAESEALLDPDGLGGFEVLEWRRGDHDRRNQDPGAAPDDG